MCGEKLDVNAFCFLQIGSPPHVRGKGQAACEIVVEFGITPACAGKSQYQRTTCQSIRDHPRMCGEKIVKRRRTIFYMGSPPHVRGKD